MKEGSWKWKCINLDGPLTRRTEAIQKRKTANRLKGIKESTRLCEYRDARAKKDHQDCLLRGISKITEHDG